MRLTCPNCGAQYELAEGVIPPEGRDVECSACSHVWFQRTQSPLRATTLMGAPAPAPASPATPIQFAPFEDEALPAPRLPDFAPIPDEEDEAPAAAPPRRPLNESLLAVLREEAAREAAARRAEAGRFEFQPDLGLSDPPKPTPATQPPQPLPQHPPAVPPEAAEPVVAPQIVAPPPVLADPEAIGATLTSARPADPPRLPEPQAAATAPAASEVGAVAPPRGGFWPGFLLALALAGAAAGAYWQAPRIAAAWPAAAPAITAYAARVDDWRARLAGFVDGLR